MPNHRDDDEHPVNANRITVSSPVVIALFLAFAGLCAGGFGTSIWWASSISTKMDVLVKQGAEQTLSTTANSSRISGLELWQRQIDATGSPAMVRRVDSLEKEMLQLGEDLRLHKAVTQGVK